MEEQPENTTYESGSQDMHTYKGLPPIRWSRQKDRAKLDNDRAAKSLFKLNELLLSRDFLNFLENIVGLDKLIDLSKIPNLNHGSDWVQYIKNIYIQFDKNRGLTNSFDSTFRNGLIHTQSIQLWADMIRNNTNSSWENILYITT